MEGQTLRQEQGRNQGQAERQATGQSSATTTPAKNDDHDTSSDETSECRYVDLCEVLLTGYLLVSLKDPSTFVKEYTPKLGEEQKERLRTSHGANIWMVFYDDYSFYRLLVIS